MDEPPVVIEFSDGERVVPAFAVPYLRRMIVRNLTYEEAMSNVDRLIENDLVSDAISSLLRDHFGLRR